MWTSTSSDTSPASSSPSPFNHNNKNYPITVNNTTNAPKNLPRCPFPPRTMEDVWKDIGGPDELNLNHAPSTRGLIFQDQDFFSGDSPLVPSSAPPPTELTLISVPYHRFSSQLLPHHHHTVIAHPVPGDNADVGNKRIPSESERNHGGDRRHKRMIKNRESAARSRARKQAYTNELELEVEHLLEENARLKKQQELSTDAQHPRKKSGFQRTSSAPF